MSEKCWLCGEEEATEEILDPNKEQEDLKDDQIPKVNVCWECARFIEWAKEEAMKAHMRAFIKSLGEKFKATKSKIATAPKDFSDWLREKYGKEPKIKYCSYCIARRV
jgi:hypothetical protein